MSREELKKLLRSDASAVDAALKELFAELENRGLTLIDDGREAELRTSPSASTLIETMRKEELSREIGKAGLETIAILLYKGPSTRSEVDFIRGVNSSHILRVLAMRGLVRKRENPKDERSFLYEPTTELLAHMGAGKREDLPEFAQIAEEIAALMKGDEKEQSEEKDDAES